MKKKILVLQKFKPEDVNKITSELSDYYDIIFPDEYVETEFLKLISEVDGVIGTKISDNLLNKLKKPILFQSVGTGVDNINLELAKNKGVVVCNSHSHSKYVAEFGVALLFSLIKKINIHDSLIRDGNWWRPTGQDDDVDYLSSTAINKKIGFIGFGNIAQNIAQFLTGFTNQFFAFDPFPKILFDSLTNKVEFLELEPLVKQSDIIFITTPLTSKTRGFINKEYFELAKKSSLWVHLSRGPVVNEGDLFNALVERQISGCAIDNWFGDEKIVGDKKYPSSKYDFHKLKNMLLSPYRAIYINSGSPHLEDAIDNLINYHKTNNLTNVVDLNKGF